MSRLTFSRTGLAAVVVLATLSVATPDVRAANLVVSQPGDPPAGACDPGACSLREAVLAADTNAEPDTITFSIPTPAVIRLSGAAIPVASAEGITITGPGSALLAISGDANDNGPDAADSRIFDLGAGGVLSLSGVRLTEGRATSGGGAILGSAGSTLVVSEAVLAANRSLTDGGAISTAGALLLGDSTATGNSADRGGAISLLGGSAVISRSTLFFNSAAARGSGLSVSGIGAGSTVVVAASTIAGNSGPPITWGGGIYVGGTIDGQFAVRDSTISGNGAGGGAGVSFGDLAPDSLIIGAGGSASLENSTVASNAAAAVGGGLYLSGYSGGGGPRVGFSSTIAGDNTAAGAGEDLDSAGAGGGGSVQASLSLIENPGDAPIISGAQGQNILGIDPELNALTTNGGPTSTHLPDERSPVIDRGLSRPGALTDQRGRARPADQAGVANAPGGDGADIGAVEIGALPPSLGRCRGEEVTLLTLAGGVTTLGTNGRDVILGTGDADDIRGRGGRDLICAAGGRDLVRGGGGDDTLLGSGGGDKLFGQGGSDVVIGAAGKDRIGGSGGADRLFGLAGDDRLAGGAGRDGLYGHGGADELRGGGSPDDLFGGRGRDRLIGGPKRDFLRGGPGRDRETQ